MPARPVPAHQIGQKVIIHHVPLPRPAVLLRHAHVLLLILGQDQARAPVVLTPALHIAQLAVGAAVRGLGDAVHIAALVVDEVALQVQLRGARCVGRTADARQCGLPALGAELPVHFLADGEAPVAAQDPRLELADATKARGGNEAGVEVNKTELEQGSENGSRRLLRT